MQKIGIALLPPQHVVNFVLEKEHYLSEKYNTLKGLSQPPHVTLKQHFKVESLEPYENYCKTLAKQISPLTLSYVDYGSFEPSILFLAVHSSSELVELHLKVLDELTKNFGINPSPFEGPDQQFHTTLVIDDISSENFEKAKKELRGWETPTISFQTNELALFQKVGEKWTIHSKYPLGR